MSTYCTRIYIKVKTKGKKEKVVYDINFLGKNFKFGKHKNSSDFLSSKISKQIYFSERID